MVESKADKAIKRKLITAAELERFISEGGEKASIVFQELVADLHKGLPPVTSEEVLYSRMKW